MDCHNGNDIFVPILFFDTTIDTLVVSQNP